MLMQLMLQQVATATSLKLTLPLTSSVSGRLLHSAKSPSGLKHARKHFIADPHTVCTARATTTVNHV